MEPNPGEAGRNPRRRCDSADISRSQRRPSAKIRALVDASELAALELPPKQRTVLAAVIDDPSVQIIVEVLGREEPANTLIDRALRAGKPVVTANKETLAKHGGALFPLAAARRVPLLCEASVGGGIPLFAALRQVQAANRITAFRGIINA